MLDLSEINKKNICIIGLMGSGKSMIRKDLSKYLNLNKNDKAIKYDSLSYKQVIEGELKVMDLTAITLCKENKLPISVININSRNNLKNFLFSPNTVGTIIK